MLGFDILLLRHLLADRLEWESWRSGHHGVLSGEACCRQMARFRDCCSFTKGVDVFPFVWWSFLLAEALLCENKQEWHRLSKRMFSHTSSSYLSPLCNHNTALFAGPLGTVSSSAFGIGRVMDLMALQAATSPAGGRDLPSPCHVWQRGCPNS